jgi:hypothetical protein
MGFHMARMLACGSQQIARGEGGNDILLIGVILCARDLVPPVVSGQLVDLVREVVEPVAWFKLNLV